MVCDKGANMVKFVKDEKLDHQFCLGNGLHNLVTVDGFEAVNDINVRKLGSCATNLLNRRTK